MTFGPIYAYFLKNAILLAGTRRILVPCFQMLWSTFSVVELYILRPSWGRICTFLCYCSFPNTLFLLCPRGCKWFRGDSFLHLPLDNEFNNLWLVILMSEFGKEVSHYFLNQPCSSCLPSASCASLTCQPCPLIFLQHEFVFKITDILPLPWSLLWSSLWNSDYVLICHFLYSVCIYFILQLVSLVD